MRADIRKVTGQSPEVNADRDSTTDLVELADALLKRAHALAAQSEQLIAALDETASRLAESGRGVKDSPLPGRVRLVERPIPRSNGSGNGSGNGSANGSGKGSSRETISEGARMLVTQMALTGHGREEIITSLREQLGVEDAEAVLEQAGF
jgi:hypothetical protein